MYTIMSNTDVQTIGESLTSLDENVINIQSRLTGMESHMTELKNQTLTNCNKLDKLQGTVDGLQVSLGRLMGIVSGLQDNVSGLIVIVSGLQGNVVEIQKSIVLIEKRLPDSSP